MSRRLRAALPLAVATATALSAGAAFAEDDDQAAPPPPPPLIISPPGAEDENPASPAPEPSVSVSEEETPGPAQPALPPPVETAIETLRPRPSPRSEKPVAMAFLAGLFAGPDNPVPFPHLGFAFGVNLGDWLMIEGAAGLPYAMIGGKVFWGSRADVAGYVAGRFGVLISGDMAAMGSIGIDISRRDGRYAFAEIGPLFAGFRDSFDNVRRWQFGAGVVSYGIGKRY